MGTLIKSFLILLILSFGLLQTNVLARDATNSPAFVEVTHTAGFFEKVQEKITLFFKFSDNDKTDYYKYLTEKRLGELKLVVESESFVDKDFQLEQTTSRYSSYLGQTTDFVIGRRLLQKKEKLLSIYEEQRLVLESLRDHFPANSGWWLLLDQDATATKIYSDKLKDLK